MAWVTWGKDCSNLILMDFADDTAQQIYQRGLDDLGAAVDADDFDGFSSLILLPLRMETSTDHTVVETSAQLRMLFDDIRSYMGRNGVEALIRQCATADFVDADTIEGSHSTWMVTPKHLIKDRYSVQSTMQSIGGQWRVVSSRHASAPLSVPNEIIEHLNRAFPGRTIGTRAADGSDGFSPGEGASPS